MEEQTKKTCPKCKKEFPLSVPFLPSNDKKLKKELGDETKTVLICPNCRKKEDEKREKRPNIGWGSR